jgi:hypothetical protein
MSAKGKYCSKVRAVTFGLVWVMFSTHPDLPSVGQGSVEQAFRG